MSDLTSGADNRPPERAALAAFRPTGKEIGAFVCALLPFALFVGSTNRVVINGQVVRDESFNVLGLILATVAIGLVIGGFRELSSKFLLGPRALHAVLLGATGLLAVYQLAKSMALI
jgi:hypothetical protein